MDAINDSLDLDSLLSDLPHSSDADDAIAIARRLLERSRSLQTHQEHRQQAELDRMIAHPSDKATLIEMTDQAFRAHNPARVADQLTHILDIQGIPRFFSPVEQTMLRGFQTFGGYLPGVAVPLVKEKMRQETANVVLPAEQPLLREHLVARQQTGVRMNVNYLGEAVLGEREADRRLQHYLQSLQMPEIQCISVKISTIFSQLSPIARADTTRTVANRLELLYRAAAREEYEDAFGKLRNKFVYLDMEEYRDLHLTAAAFRETLRRPGMGSVRAGIALQAYVPDSYAVMEEILDWSAKRVENGGYPITVRLVKGANMEMERVDASIAGLEPTPFQQKVHTDAHFKRMLKRLIEASAKGHVLIGVASHNLFDIALALLWGIRTHLDGRLLSADNTLVPHGNSPTGTVLDHIQFEMLEGMANHQRRALAESAAQMLLYAPACRRQDFIHAIGYLIRRLDENTGPDNFLRHAFRLAPDSDIWDRLAESFRQSLDQLHSVDSSPRRTQDRRTSPRQPLPAISWQNYVNEPDTDWSLQHHAQWAQSIVDRWQARCDEDCETVPLHVAGRLRIDERNVRESYDPSRPGVVSCRYTLASESDVDDAITAAENGQAAWQQMRWNDRYELFRAAAQLMRERRAELIGAMMVDGGKVISEADPEVSEAIDFAEFYPLTMRPYLDRSHGNQFRPRGTVAVISPWNFPLAIPCGGIVAALAAGNTVILKPASDTVLPAYLMAKCFWDAGVPRHVLQLIPCSGAGAGKRLVNDRRIDAVVLTGGTATAKEMLELRPDLHLVAETGGKNATIVTALADRDLAIKNVLHSAFGHAGQKCSATSLLLLQRELYHDAEFQEALADAARSLPVGSAWDLTSRVGPLIRPPSGSLERGLKELESGEEWLVMPRPDKHNPQLYSPGIKWNVQPGSFTHQTELFGPVLGVMPFGRLEEAIAAVNETGYGLTSGLESLDDREQTLWKDNVHAGNLYINRPTTGAIVLRQPFGGIGSSGYGPGAKAGGPHYVLALGKMTSFGPRSPQLLGEASARALPDGPVADAAIAIGTVLEASDGEGVPHWAEFASEVSGFADDVVSRTTDHVGLIGQDNLRRYVPVGQLRVRLNGSESTGDIVFSLLAAAAANCSVTYSLPICETSQETAELLSEILDSVADNGKSTWRPEWIEETDESLASEISDGRIDRLRVFGEASRPSKLVLAACREAFVTLLGESVAKDAEIETLRYLNEQSISHNYHRYGNLGRRKRS